VVFRAPAPVHDLDMRALRPSTAIPMQRPVSDMLLLLLLLCCRA